MDGQDPLISILVPVLNEAECLPRLVEKLSEHCDASRFDFEFVFVDDGSSDQTPATLRALRQRDHRVRFLSLSRNFGHQSALTAGLDHVQGDAVVMMDGDLQHPPELIPELIRKWQDGFDVVHAIRRPAADVPLVKRVLSRMFYRVFNRVSGTQIRPGSADFRLLARPVVEQLQGLPERGRFLRGLIPWLGFRQTEVEFDAPPRYAGRPAYSLLRSLRLALDGITSFSFFPLRQAFLLGLLLTVLSAAYGIFVLGTRLLTNDTVPGWTSLLLCIVFLGGCQLLSLGLVGEYVGRIYEEVKQRPVYIIREAVGFDTAATAAARKAASDRPVRRAA